MTGSAGSNRNTGPSSDRAYSSPVMSSPNETRRSTLPISSLLGDDTVDDAHRPDLSGAVVAVHVGADDAGQACAPVHVPAGDRAARSMGVLEQRCHVAFGGLIVVEALRTLVRAPTEADAAPGARRATARSISSVRLGRHRRSTGHLDAASNEKRHGCAGRSTRSRAGRRPPDQRVVSGNGVAEIARRCHRVDPQQLAEQRRWVERQPIGVAARAPVAQSVVEVAVRTRT